MTTDAAAPVRQHVRFMDGLRGIAVLLVVLFHLAHHGWWPNAPSWVNGGLMGVEIFFFLSGFALFYPYAQHLFEHRPLQTLGHYVDRRVRKIVPSYVLALTVMAVWEACVAPIPSLNYVREWLVHLFFVHNFWSASFMSINAPFWTLAVEVQFYLLFPAFARGFMRAPWQTMGGLFILSMLYRSELSWSGEDQSFFWVNQLPGFLDLFGFGSLTAYAMVRGRSRGGELSKTMTGVWSAAACLAAVAIYATLSALGGYYAPHRQNDLPFRNTMHDYIGPLLFVLSMGVTRGFPVLRRLLEIRWLLWLSVISYNLYIWNDWIDAVFGPSFTSMLGSVLGKVMVGLVLLAVNVGAAWLLTVGVEKPCLEGAFPGMKTVAPQGEVPKRPMKAPGVLAEISEDARERH